MCHFVVTCHFVHRHSASLSINHENYLTHFIGDDQFVTLNKTFTPDAHSTEANEEQLAAKRSTAENATKINMAVSCCKL